MLDWFTCRILARRMSITLLHAYASVPPARANIGRYFGCYNTRRPNSSLNGTTPGQASFNQPLPEAVAA